MEIHILIVLYMRENLNSYSNRENKNNLKIENTFFFFKVMLNIEWGTFSDDGHADIIKTKYDDLIDKQSLHPNLFT